MSKVLVKNVDIPKIKVDTSISDNHNLSNMHNMPFIDSNHKTCGVSNCMSCAFNIMSAYFTTKHACNAKTTPRQHPNNKMHVKTKTVVHTKVSVKSFVPKLKQQVVKAIYKVKCAVTDKVDVKIKSVVLPDKGQFFKYAGPSQCWVPRTG